MFTTSAERQAFDKEYGEIPNGRRSSASPPRPQGHRVGPTHPLLQMHAIADARRRPALCLSHERCGPIDWRELAVQISWHIPTNPLILLANRDLESGYNLATSTRLAQGTAVVDTPRTSVAAVSESRTAASGAWLVQPPEDRRLGDQPEYRPHRTLKQKPEAEDDKHQH